MAGKAGFEPTSARVKVWCLTAWRHPNIIVGWTMGLEPTTTRTTIWRSSQLNYIHHINININKKMVRPEGFEPPTHGLEGRCSIQLSYERIFGAGDGNRTHAASLEGWNSTVELHPHVWSGKRDSNSRRSPWQGDALPLSHSRINNAP